MNLNSDQNELGKSGSSVLIPLADQDSLFSQKQGDYEDYDDKIAQEENEKAIVIQRMYRK